jgi:hypothetical protein
VSTKTDTSPETKLDDGTGGGFPFAHIRSKAQYPWPVRPGDIALCGAVLQGIDLDGAVVRKVCPRCSELALEMIQW